MERIEISDLELRSEHNPQWVNVLIISGDSDIVVSTLFEYKVWLGFDAPPQSDAEYANLNHTKWRGFNQVLAEMHRTFGGEFDYINNIVRWHADITADILWLRTREDVLQLKLTLVLQK